MSLRDAVKGSSWVSRGVRRMTLASKVATNSRPNVIIRAIY